jgi:hypothetical protein
MAESTRPLPPEAIAALSGGKKIEAIKIVRQEWGVDLKDAKDAVDAYVKSQPTLAASMQEASAGSQRGCITWLLFLALAGFVLYYFLRAR